MSKEKESPENISENKKIGDAAPTESKAPIKLSRLPLSCRAVITAVGGEGALRCRLLDMGLIPKTELVIVKTAPMGDPIELFLRGYELTVRLEDAEHIEVLPLE